MALFPDENIALTRQKVSDSLGARTGGFSI